MNSQREMNCSTKMGEKEKEGLETELKVIIRRQMERIFAVWYKFGLDRKIQIPRTRIIWNHIQNLLKDVHAEEITDSEIYEARNKGYKEKIRKLRTVLQMTPIEPVVAGSLIVQEEILSRELALLTKYQDLKNEELKLCQQLNLPKQEPPLNAEVPLKDVISELEKQVKILNEENERRQVKFDAARNSLSTCDSIEQEIDKCKAIKSGNIESFILNIQSELVQLWDKCYVSQLEREKFPYLHSTEQSIEVLEAHKIEVDNWKKHFSKVEHILKKIDKWKLLWEALNVLGVSANDPNRFRCSKSNLWNEYKKRVEIKKDLLALEKDIFNDIEELKKKDGSRFLYNGEDFKTFVENKISERNRKMENQKVEKRNEHSFNIKKPAVEKPLRRAASVNSSKSSQPSQLKRSKTLYMDGNFKTPVANRAKSSNQNSDARKGHFVQKSRDVNLRTPLEKTVTVNFAKTAPSKIFKSLKTMSPFSTPTLNRSKVVPSTVARMTSKTGISPTYLLQRK